MATSTFSKTGGVALLAPTSQASNTVTVGSWVDVATALAARVGVSFGRTTNTALSYQVRFALQASLKDSGDDEAFTVYEWTTAKATASCAGQSLSTNITAGDSTLVLASGSGFVRGDLCCINNGTLANIEWFDLKDISGSTLTPFSNLTRACTSGIQVTASGERFAWTEMLAGIKRLRLIVDSASLGASGQTSVVQAWLMKLDSVQTS